MKMNTRKVMRTVLVSALLMSSQPTLFANEKDAVVYASLQPAAAVTYIGVQDGYYVFQVNYTKSNDLPAILKITDGNGTEIYRTSFKDKVFNRTIKIAREGYKNLSFVFDARGQASVTKSYSINSELVEKVEVSEIAKL